MKLVHYFRLGFIQALIARAIFALKIEFPIIISWLKKKNAPIKCVYTLKGRVHYSCGPGGASPWKPLCFLAFEGLCEAILSNSALFLGPILSQKMTIK